MVSQMVHLVSQNLPTKRYKMKKYDTVLIEKYLDGELLPEQVQEFEKRIQEDKEFAKLVCVHKSINQVLSNQKLVKTALQIKNIAQEYQNELERKKTF